MSDSDIAEFLRSRTPAQLNRGYRRPNGQGSMDWGDFDQPNIPAKYRERKPEFVYGFADGQVVSKNVNFGKGNWFPKPVMIGRITTRISTFIMAISSRHSTMP